MRKNLETQRNGKEIAEIAEIAVIGKAKPYH
jgi:hypothetical protein